MDSPKKKRRKVVHGSRSDGDAREARSSPEHANFDVLPEGVFRLILEFLIIDDDISSLPAYVRRLEKVPLWDAENRQSFESYRAFLFVNQRWNRLTKRAIEKVRLDCLQWVFQDSPILIFFECIYQPHGYDLPANIAARIGIEALTGALVPPEGVLFTKTGYRDKECASLYHNLTWGMGNRSLRSVRKMAGEWTSSVPPFKIEGVGIVHIQNRVEEEPPVQVGKHNNGIPGYCVRHPEGPWTTVDNGEELPNEDVTIPCSLYPLSQHLLSLVTLQGEDLCANFIRDQAPRWMTQL